MKGETDKIHEAMKALAAALELVPSREVSKSVLSLRLDGAYRPHINSMRGLTLHGKQRDAIGWATGLEAGDITHLPIVGIEVEGTTPTAKTLEHGGHVDVGDESACVRTVAGDPEAVLRGVSAACDGFVLGQEMRDHPGKSRGSAWSS